LQQFRYTAEGLVTWRFINKLKDFKINPEINGQPMKGPQNWGDMGAFTAIKKES